MKIKLFFLSLLLGGAWYFLSPESIDESNLSTAANNVREGPRAGRSLAAVVEDFKKAEARRNKLKLQIMESEHEIERYSAHLNYLYSSHFEDEKQQLALRLNEGGDSELSKQDADVIEDHLKEMEERDELKDKYKSEALPDDLSEMDFYERLIREKQDELSDLEREIK